MIYWAYIGPPIYKYNLLISFPCHESVHFDPRNMKIRDYGNLHFEFHNVMLFEIHMTISDYQMLFSEIKVYFL